MSFVRLGISTTIYICDAVSVERIAKEPQLESPSPIIAYMPQGTVKTDYPSLQECSFFLANNDTVSSRYV